MQLRRFFTTVTPLSKTLAISLFVSLPFLGFYLGYQYKKSITIPETQQVVEENKVATETPIFNQDLLKICGDLPDNLKIVKDHYTQVKGPKWSPDCRHIAWSIWQSGPMGVEYKGPYAYEGLFLYNDKTGTSKRIYIPKNGETIEFQEWVDSNLITFIKDGQRQLYTLNIVDNTISD